MRLTESHVAYELCIIRNTGWAKKPDCFSGLITLRRLVLERRAVCQNFRNFIEKKGTKLAFQLVSIFFAKFAKTITTAEIMLYMTRKHGFYSIYTNIQWNNCHFPTELVQMFQLVNVWNFATIKIRAVWRPVFRFNELRHIWAQVSKSVAWTMCRCSVLLKQIGEHCSRWCIVAKFQTLTSWNIWTNCVGKWQLFHCMPV